MKQLGLEVSFQLRSLLMLNTFEVAMFLHISSFCENTLMFPIFVSLFNSFQTFIMEWLRIIWSACVMPLASLSFSCTSSFPGIFFFSVGLYPTEASSKPSFLIIPPSYMYKCSCPSVLWMCVLMGRACVRVAAIWTVAKWDGSKLFIPWCRRF